MLLCNLHCVLILHINFFPWCIGKTSPVIGNCLPRICILWIAGIGVDVDFMNLKIPQEFTILLVHLSQMLSTDSTLLNPHSVVVRYSYPNQITCLMLRVYRCTHAVFDIHQWPLTVMFLEHITTVGRLFWLGEFASHWFLRTCILCT